VCGPFPTPFSRASKYDHVIVICSGSGITAGAAVASYYRKLKKHIYMICESCLSPATGGWGLTHNGRTGVASDQKLVSAFLPAIIKVRTAAAHMPWDGNKKRLGRLTHGATCHLPFRLFSIDQLELPLAYVICKAKAPQPNGDTRFAERAQFFGDVVSPLCFKTFMYRSNWNL
jgi:hypothetical protein